MTTEADPVARLEAELSAAMVQNAELVRSRDRYQSLLETADAIPWEFDLTTSRCTYMGPQAVQLLGYPLESWSRPGFLFSIVHPDDRVKCRAELERLRVYKPKELDAEYRFLTASGQQVQLRSRVTVVKDGRRVMLRMLSFDVTHQKRLEFDLLQAQKLEALGRLSAGVAHEINTPIQFVGDSLYFLGDSGNELLGLIAKYREALVGVEVPGRTALEEAEQSLDLPYVEEQFPQAVQRATVGISRVAAIVKSLRAFAHSDQPEKVPADLNEAIENALIMAKSEYKLVAEVKTELGEIPLVPCHLGELNQVFLNLIVNAAHAIGDVVARSGAKGLITVSTRTDGDTVCVSISDTGTGIDEPNRKRIFEPFFTTKPLGKGTGQGLAIAQAIMTKHDGQILLETELGKGSTFTLRLPLPGGLRATG